jgi:hypothetical protein
MGDILDGTTDFDAVRDLIPITESEFSDSQIEQFTFLEVIEALVKEVITDWSTLKTAAGTDWLYVRNGTACLLALKIASRIQSSGSKSSGAGFSVGGYREQTGQVNWETKTSELMACASAAFGSISTQTRTVLTLGVFSGPTSSGRNIPADYEAYWEKIQPRFVDFLEEDEDEDD